MQRVTVTQLKNGLSHYLRLVKQGQTLEIVERSVPIARIEAIARRRGRRKDQLVRLVRDGVVAVAKKRPDRGLVDKPPVACDADVVKALVEERGDR